MTTGIYIGYTKPVSILIEDNMCMIRYTTRAHFWVDNRKLT